MINKNTEVTKFLDQQNHPLRDEIEQLRKIILTAIEGLKENIKWNGPNYCFQEEDRITMKIQPPKQLQLIFHCGVKVKMPPKEKLIRNDHGLLIWKGNDRAVATFKNMADIHRDKLHVGEIVKEWIKITT